jgi:hypothetical protein
MLKKKTFREFCQLNGEGSATMKYLKEFEAENPGIAAEFFDMRFPQEM